MLKYPGVKSVICGEAGQHSKLNKVYWQQLYACMFTMDMNEGFVLSKNVDLLKSNLQVFY
jgi:hypothetical protein